ncbi:MAG: hypothetical protein LBI33_10740, partial [Propionibacteriaceae bacterium]|nr:hypothetical protein [Propionibacteriaceae bacterium]
MVATLLKLRFRLAIAELKRSTVRLVLTIIFGLYALVMVAALVILMLVAAGTVNGHQHEAGAIIVVVGSVVVVGWILLPLVFFGSDQTLDPARFAQFPLTGRKLAPGLVVAGLVGLPGLITALLCVGSALLWIRHPGVVLVGVVGGALGFLMTQVTCRMAATALAGTLSSRKAKDMTGLIGLVLILLLSSLGYVISLVAARFSASGNWTQAMAASQTAGTILSWTPLGAPWALVGDAAAGSWGLLVVHLVLTLAYLAAGLWAYGAVLDKALQTPAHEGTTGVLAHDSIAKAASWPWAAGRYAPVAAITARCLRYWRRDPRYLGTIPAMLLLPVLFTVMGKTVPADEIGSFFTVGIVAFGLGLMALMAGYSLSADVAFDASAWWIHLAAGVKGWQDRLGRVVAQALWCVPFVLVVGIAVPVIMGAPGRIPTTLGAMAALYLVGLGVASVFSALFIYPVALPGESPLRMKTGMMGTQMLAQMGSLLGAGLLGLPVCLWAVFA